MIIDAHCHVFTWDIVPDVYWNEFAGVVNDVFRRNRRSEMTVEQVRSKLVEPMMDPDGSKLIANMDASGVDKSFILALDWGYGRGDVGKPIDEINRFYGSLAEKYPDRLVAFAGVDPRREDAVDILDRAVHDYGCRGLKYHPTSGFYPDGEESYRVLEKARELGIPLLSHLGPISKPFKSKYAQPVYLDSVVSDFPEITVIGAHMSFCWWHELLNIIASKATTFYADLSGHQIAARKDFNQFCHMLRTALDEAHSSRILWGTDNPMLEPVVSMKDWLQMFKDLPGNAPDGLEFTKEEIDAVLGDNAAGIFGF